jgi:tripartite-type tricarboxylate transporter receptor subunit TctC
VPKGTPRATILKLHSVTQKVLADSEVKQHYANQGLSPLGSASPDEFGKFFQADFARMARLAKVAGLKPE